MGHGCVAYVLARNRPELLQMQSRRHCTRQSVYMCSSRTFEYLLLKISTEATPETCRMAARSVSSESPSITVFQTCPITLLSCWAGDRARWKAPLLKHASQSATGHELDTSQENRSRKTTKGIHRGKAQHTLSQTRSQLSVTPVRHVNIGDTRQLFNTPRKNVRHTILHWLQHKSIQLEIFMHQFLLVQCIEPILHSRSDSKDNLCFRCFWRQR